jgi:hypothetical protein
MFLVASKWGFKEKTLPLDCEHVEKSAKLKFSRDLYTINKGSRNFIQLNWSTG